MAENQRLASGMTEWRWETESGVLLASWFVGESFTPGVRVVDPKGVPQAWRALYEGSVTRWIFPDDSLVVPR
jgi:hypothetical protein